MSDNKKVVTTDVVTTEVVTAVTAFGFHKIVNEALKKGGFTMVTKSGEVVTKAIPPQMIYNYTHARINKGKAPFIPVNKEGLINLVDGQKWLDGYLLKLSLKK